MKKPLTSPQPETSEDLAKWLEAPGWPSAGGPLPTRDEIYDRSEQGERITGEVTEATKSRQRESVGRFLALPGFPGIAVDRPTREELYSERLFPRHDDQVRKSDPKSADDQ